MPSDRSKTRVTLGRWAELTIVLAIGLAGGCTLHNGSDATPATTQPARTLFDAARNGDVTAARRFLEAGANPDAIQAGQRPIHWAARRGHLEVVRLLLAAGADPHVRADRERTSLHLAAAAGHADVARLLLQCGVSVNAIDNQRFTALHLAAEAGHADVTRVLMEYGADPDARSGILLETPVGMAFWRAHYDVVHIIKSFEKK